MARLQRQMRHGYGDDGSEPSPYLRGRPANRLIAWSKPRLVVGVVAAALVGILLYSVVSFAGAASVLPYRTGLAGVPGTASLPVCTAVDDSGVDVAPPCYATFAGTEGRHDVDEAVIEGDALVYQQDYPARLHPDGRTISLVSATGALYTAAQLFGSLVGIVLSAGFLAIGGHATARRWLGRVHPLAYRLPALWIAKACGVGAAAMIACYLVARAVG